MPFDGFLGKVQIQAYIFMLHPLDFYTHKIMPNNRESKELV